MFDLHIIQETPSIIIFDWPTYDRCDGIVYEIQGVTKTCEYVFIKRLSATHEALTKSVDYVGYRVSVISVFGQHETVIDASNVTYVRTDWDEISLYVLPAPFNKKSISFRSEKHYDLYRFYYLDEEYKEHYVATEDCIVILDAGLMRYPYYVEGYMQTEHGYRLCAVSEKKPWDDSFREAPFYDLTVVIPVYNAEDFLIRAVQSVLSSSYLNTKIILVDDGSEVYTARLCDTYSKMYSEISVIHQENSGVCIARNAGMAAVETPFMAFMDNDDIVHPYMYEKLVNVLKTENYEFAIAQCLMREDYNSYKYVLSANINENVIRMNSYKEVIESKGKQKNIFFVAIWNKVMKTDFARKVQFVEDMPYYEDTAYTNPLYSFADRFILIKDAIYVWDKRKQKTVGTASTTHYHRPSEVIWKYYILSYASGLFRGNFDKTAADVYKYDIVKHLLTKYSEHNFADPIKNVFSSLLKYFDETYDMPFEKLLCGSDAEKKLYAAWSELEARPVSSWNGVGDIPANFYK